VAARVWCTHREPGFRPRREGSIVTNPAGRDKPDAGGAEKPVRPSDGVPGPRHPRVAAEEIDDAESDASPADAAHGVRAARRSKQGQYRAKSHRLIKGAEERKVRTGRRDHFVGDVPMTRLNGKLVSGESFLEIDALTVRDFDGGFHDVVAQPFKTSIFVGSKKRSWTPDFLFLNSCVADGVVEVKMLSWLYHKDPAKAALAKKRLDAMEAACAELGFTFSLLTEDEIRVEPRLYNAKMAQRHCGPLVPESSIVLGLSALAAAPDTVTIREFGNMIAPLHPIHGLGLAIKLERPGHVRIDGREKYSFVHHDQDRGPRDGDLNEGQIHQGRPGPPARSPLYRRRLHRRIADVAADIEPGPIVDDRNGSWRLGIHARRQIGSRCARRKQRGNRRNSNDNPLHEMASRRE
jgi:hypothetical protein